VSERQTGNISRWFFEGPGDEDSYTQRLIGIFVHWRTWATLLLALVAFLALYWPAAPVEKRLWGFVVGIVFITIADALKER
jgi:uncharacterized BrkB/YihY/UPF0761 family membrane protein